MSIPDIAVAKTRLLILTDISSLTPSIREPDDGQSMIRLMLYTNEFDIEGLIASSNMGHGQVTRPELIRQVIEAYAQIRPNLLLHSPDYPSAEYLLARVKSGQPAAGPKSPVADAVGAGKDTEASRWIIAAVDKPDPRPLWIAIWGGSADLAQALWTVRNTRSAADLAAFIAKIRVHAIGDQDSTGPWIKEQFPRLYYITRGRAIRGMYRAGDASLCGPDWVERHIRVGHGALGALYPNYDGGDIWSGRLGRVRGIKEGDSPSFLGLIPNGLNDPDHPEWGGWGGRCQIAPGGNDKRLEDAIDDDVANPSDPDPRMSSVYRWRPAFQADFQARLDWCIKPYAQANHAPVGRIAGNLRPSLRSGERIELDASLSTDPDKQRLSYRWDFYKGPGSYTGNLTLDQSTSSRAAFSAPKVSSPQTIHIILTVTDNGDPPLSSYARIVATVEPG